VGNANQYLPICQFGQGTQLKPAKDGHLGQNSCEVYGSFRCSFCTSFVRRFFSCRKMATRRTGQLVQRSTASSGISPEDNPDIEGNEGYESDEETGDRKETRLTLMEEVLLLGLKDKEVNVRSFRLSLMSLGLCIMNYFAPDR